LSSAAAICRPLCEAKQQRTAAKGPQEGEGPVVLLDVAGPTALALQVETYWCVVKTKNAGSQARESSEITACFIIGEVLFQAARRTGVYLKQPAPKLGCPPPQPHFGAPAIGPQLPCGTGL
jgi:hypothetical protein